MRSKSETPALGKAANARGPGFSKFLLFYLHMCGFTASTLLMTWGLFALLFIALGGFSLDGMMHQIHNLSSRYIVADGDRIASFKHVFLAAHLILSGALIVLRLRQLLPADISEGNRADG